MKGAGIVDAFISYFAFFLSHFNCGISILIRKIKDENYVTFFEIM